MKEIHVNLKRFDVPRKYGGLCPSIDSPAWIETVIEETVSYGLGNLDGIRLCFFLPESLLQPASDVIRRSDKARTRNLFIGSQGVYRSDVEPGRNFGAFTTNLPATAAVNLGATWAIIGHSEERKDKEEILQVYHPEISNGGDPEHRAKETINTLLNQEATAGMKAGMNILFCIGETEREKGSGDFIVQKTRIEEVLRSQLAQGLVGLRDFSDRELILGYEPRWAIGPGKTPPDADYIDFISSTVKKICSELYGAEYPVLYGGGLKEANASMIAGVNGIDGGLVALTRFTGEIGFFVDDLRIIIEKYRQ